MIAMSRALFATKRRKAAKNASPSLPPLTMPCVACNGVGSTPNPRYEAWDRESDAARKVHEEAHPNDWWYSTDAWEAFADTEPDVSLNCPECDGNGEILTSAGKQVSAFVFCGDALDRKIGSFLRRNNYWPKGDQ